MLVKNLCPKCGGELDESGLHMFGSSLPCKKCGSKTLRSLADKRYFPEQPGNKVFAVDIYVTVCKCLKVEAANEEDADKKAQDYVAGLAKHPDDSMFIHVLADEGFQDAEDLETKVSGEAGEDGDIEYY